MNMETVAILGLISQISQYTRFEKWLLPYWFMRNSKTKTAFFTPFGKYQFEAVSFGLAQAPTYFQQLISMVLQDCSSFVMAYLDDIIIYTIANLYSALGGMPSSYQLRFTMMFTTFYLLG